MLKLITESRTIISSLTSFAVWLTGWMLVPFPQENLYLSLVYCTKSHIFYAIKYGYIVMWFTTPYMAVSILLSLLCIFFTKYEQEPGKSGSLRYPAPAGRKDLQLVIGELHHPRKPEPSRNPCWLTIPERGLYTGIAIFGAVGSGKTTCCMYPFAEQILAYRSNDSHKTIGGLVLEVKGDFCHKVREILAKHGREHDFVEMSLRSPYRYNPLHNELEAYALAYGIASLLNNMFGRGKEPFWQQAYTNLVKFLILLHKVLYDYVTLFDVYECAINPDLIQTRIEEAEHRFTVSEYILMRAGDYLEHSEELERYGFENQSERVRMRAAYSEELEARLKSLNVPYELEACEGTDDEWRPLRGRA